MFASNYKIKLRLGLGLLDVLEGHVPLLLGPVLVPGPCPLHPLAVLVPDPVPDLPPSVPPGPLPVVGGAATGAGGRRSPSTLVGPDPALAVAVGSVASVPLLG